MASISAYDSSSVSVLFSSLNSNSKNTASTNILGINYGDYATIRNGSYLKLMKAYYNDGKTIGNTQTSTSTAADEASKLARIENDTDSLTESAEALYKDRTLFQKTTTTDSEGKTTTDYNTDEIYKKVKQFVTDYNSAVKSAGSSDTTRIANAAASMVNYTTQNSGMLGSVGITIDSEDFTLSLDEDAFRKSDMSTVKSLFSGAGSYAYSTAVKSSMIHHYAESEAAKSNTYSASGSYTYNYSTGTLYNSTT